jgi:hypothetical protein
MNQNRESSCHMCTYFLVYTQESRRDVRTQVIFRVRHTTIVTEVLLTLKHIEG